MAATNETELKSHGTVAEPRPNSRWLEWFGMSIVGLCVWSLAAAHAPGPIRWLGLFGICYGLAGGYGAGKLAVALGLKPSPRLTLPAFVLLAAGGFGVVWESRRIYAAELWAVYGQRPLRDDISASSAAIGPEDGWLADSLLTARKKRWEEETSWDAYFAWRLSGSPLRDLSARWAWVTAFAEWACGAIGGTWLFARMVRRGPGSAPPGSSLPGESLPESTDA